MEYMLPLIAFAGVLFYLAVRRGRTTLQAAMYLMYMKEGTSIKDANNACKGLGYQDAAKHQAGIIRHASAPFGGSQLRMIEAARLSGFEG